MPLTLYRRHLAACKHHSSRRPWPETMDCACPIWIYGDTSKAHYQHSLKTKDLVEAEVKRHRILLYDGDLEIPAAPPSPRGPTIEDCISRFVYSRRPEIGGKAEKSYRTQLGRLCAYCSARGVKYAQQLTVDLLEDFKIEGLPAEITDASRAYVVNKVRAFLVEAYRREWITTDLARKMRPHSFEHEQKSPYTDEEVDLILANVHHMDVGRSGFASQPQTFRLLLELMLETGLRVSDAVRFDPTKLQRGDTGLWVYPYAQTKRRKAKRVRLSETYIPDALKVAIDGAKWLSPALPFWYGNSPESHGYSITQQVYERMQTIGASCGVSDCRPHRLRDTFAVRALLRGITITDVSRLLGHSSVRITEQYYAAWVPARGRRLEAIVAQSLAAASGMDPGGNGGGDG